MSTRQRAATAEERLARLLQLQGLLGRVAREIGPAEELQPVLSTVLAAMRSLVEFKGGTIQLVDERGVYIAASDPVPPGEDLAAARVPIGTGLSGRIVATGEPIYSPDITTDTRVDPEIRKLGTNALGRSYLAVPLVVLGKTIGVLQIDSAEVDAFNEDDMAVLVGLATQVAGAIESARRFEEVLELERLKGDFIARISHELRTPLTIMGGFTDTLLMHGDNLPPERREEVLRRVKTSIERLSGLLEEILYVASLDAGMTHVKPEDLALEPLLADVAQLALDASRVTISCPPGLRLRTDPVILRHILNQLIDNALKYGGDAEVAIDGDGDGGLVLSVRDHGPGVPPEDRERIFERFWRGNHTGAGMGLGLPTVRQLAASLGALVTVGDAEGGGAVFEVHFTP